MPPSVGDDQRWSSMRRGPSESDHTAPGARCDVTFVIEHARGRSRHELVLVRGDLGPAIVDDALAELPAR